MIGQFCIISCNCEHSEQHSQPGGGDSLAAIGGMLRSSTAVFKVDTQLRFEVFNIYEKTPKGLDYLFVDLESPAAASAQ